MNNVVYMDEWRASHPKVDASLPLVPGLETVPHFRFNPKEARQLMLPAPAELVFPAPKTWLEKLQDLLK